MNYEQAAMLLGVDPGTPVDAARKEYVARARILHPDRYAGAPEADIKAASNAMAQLNEAWETYQQGPQSAPSSSYRYEPEPDPDPDFPIYSGTDVCDMCGWGPARRVKFNMVQGLILFWRWNSLDARLCRLCGLGAYNESQRATLTRGWWGIIAPIATVIAFFSNLSRVGTIKSLPNPQGRSPHALALFPIPMLFTTPWYKRPLAWVSTIIAVTIIGWIFLGVIADSASRSTRTTPTVPTAPAPAPAPSINANANGVGTCWEESGGTMLRKVECDDPNVAWRGVANRASPDLCPGSSYLNWDGGTYLCLVRD